MNIDYHLSSFRRAYMGLKYAFSQNPNFKIHLIISVLVVIMAVILKVVRNDFIILTLTIAFGFTVEFLNTAIEAVCDLVTFEWRREIRIAKDVAAAMMLFTAFSSVIIGLLIFYPYIFNG